MLNHATATISSTRFAVPSIPAESTPAAAADLQWDFALICVAGYILTAVGRVHQLFPVVGVLRPAVLTALFATALYIFSQHEERRPRHLFVPTTNYLVALLCWMVLAVPSALVIGTSFEMVFNNFSKTFLMCLVMAGTVRGIRDVERLALVYLMAATLYAAVVLLRFDLGGGENWRLSLLYYYDANDFATYVVTALPLALYFLHAGRRTSGRVGAAFALAVLALAFVRAGSRGGFIALIAVVGFVVLRYSAIALRQRVLATALVALIVLTTASDQYWTQMSTTLSDDDYNRTDESGRMQIWSRGVGYMLGRPLFGVGPGNFPTAEGMLSLFAARQQFGAGVRWNAAHNSYVQVGAELGLPGLLLFIGLLASAFAALGRSNRRGGAPDGAHSRAELTQALTASLTGFVVGAFFLSLAYLEMLYALLALVIGLEKVTRGPAAWRGAA